MRVKVINKGDRRNLVLRWIDPETGRQRQKSAGTRKLKEAERQAAVLQADLDNHRYCEPSKIRWDEFREVFETERIPSYRPSTAVLYDVTFNHVERLINPRFLSELTTARISRFQSLLSNTGVSQETVGKNLRQLKAALNWACKMGYLRQAPLFIMPKRESVSGGVKGRPLTDEEFETLLAAVPRVVGEAAAESWRFYLKGMLWTGLRLTESLRLTWDRPDLLCVDFEGEIPMMRIPANLDKGNRTRVRPLTPQFFQMLQSVPDECRTSFVFQFPGERSLGDIRQRIMKTAVRIGKASGVIVKKQSKNHAAKYASLHDIRRTFAERVSRKLRLDEVQEMLGHASIETTKRYYVGSNAERTGRRLWEAFTDESA